MLLHGIRRRRGDRPRRSVLARPMPQGSDARLFPLAFDAFGQHAYDDELFEFGQILEPLGILAEPLPHRWPVGDREDEPFETLRIKTCE